MCKKSCTMCALANILHMKSVKRCAFVLDKF